VSWLPNSFGFGIVQVRACRRKATRASTRKADEGGIPGRMPTEENAAPCVQGRAKSGVTGEARH
jgi:hypothetical protein